MVNSMIDQDILEQLWAEYSTFCSKAVKTQDMQSSSVSDFLGWLNNKHFCPGCLDKNNKHWDHCPVIINS